MAKKRTVTRKAAATTRATFRFDALAVLQCVVAVFLVTLGLIALIEYDSDAARFVRGVNRFFGRSSDPLTVIVAVVEIVAGVLVLAALFAPVKRSWLYWTTLVIAIAWAAWILVDLVVNRAFQPTFLAWLNQLASSLVLLLALRLINRKYA
jgi:hypothetical protein